MCAQANHMKDVIKRLPCDPTTSFQVCYGVIGMIVLGSWWLFQWNEISNSNLGSAVLDIRIYYNSRNVAVMQCYITAEFTFVATQQLTLLVVQQSVKDTGSLLLWKLSFFDQNWTPRIWQSVYYQWPTVKKSSFLGRRNSVVRNTELLLHHFPLRYKGGFQTQLSVLVGNWYHRFQLLSNAIAGFIQKRYYGFLEAYPFLQMTPHISSHSKKNVFSESW